MAEHEQSGVPNNTGIILITLGVVALMLVSILSYVPPFRETNLYVPVNTVANHANGA